MVHRTGTNLPLIRLIRSLKTKAESSISINPFNERAEWSPGTEMSGGERKKRTPRGTGWEEAGGEFYQESYPGAELDLEALPRDPHYFATLLPSKQNRAATTRKPSKVDNKATYRRRTSTRQRNTNTMGQNTIPNDIQVAMMPDLSENLANEETTWEEMMLIKAMPVTMAQKKEIKAKLLSADTFRMQGMRRLKWRRRKLWEYLKVRWKEFHLRTQLWRSSFQKMDGRFGPAITTFFAFIKWLMLLNFFAALVVVSFIVLPTVVIDEYQDECLPTNLTLTSIPCCSQLYAERNSTTLTSQSGVFEMLHGSGWLDRTVIYYGFYTYAPLSTNGFSYDLPVAYVATFIAVFALFFCAILKAGSAGFKDRLIEGEGQYYKFCSLVFSGWDFCLNSDKGTSAKHKALFLEMKEHIEEERREDDKKNRTRDECCRMLITRLSMNVLIKLIFVAASSLIYFTIQFVYSELQLDDLADEYRLLLEYVPALSIVGVNLVVPNILHYLVTLEGYSPQTTQWMILLRNLLLRFSTISMLLISLRSLVECSGSSEACVSHSCQTPLCWETFAAQQILKILVVDFLVQIALTFLINFPRMLLARHVRCKLTKVMCLQEFDILKHLLDIVYVEFLVWLSSFFMPLMPLLGGIILFILFYVKKFACMVNSLPSSTTLYRVKKSISLYLLVLLGTFFAATGPLVYAAITLQPSKSCGPFRGQPTYATFVESTYKSFPFWFQSAVALLTSSTVAFPTLVFLLLLFYYYYILTRENRQMVIVLKKQLVLEGHDKQFLLNRLSAFIKQHQERHKPARSIDPPVVNSA